MNFKRLVRAASAAALLVSLAAPTLALAGGPGDGRSDPSSEDWDITRSFDLAGALSLAANVQIPIQAQESDIDQKVEPKVDIDTEDQKAYQDVWATQKSYLDNENEQVYAPEVIGKSIAKSGSNWGIGNDTDVDIYNRQEADSSTKGDNTVVVIPISAAVNVGDIHGAYAGGGDNSQYVSSKPESGDIETYSGDNEPKVESGDAEQFTYGKASNKAVAPALGGNAWSWADLLLDGDSITPTNNDPRHQNSSDPYYGVESTGGDADADADAHCATNDQDLDNTSGEAEINGALTTGYASNTGGTGAASSVITATNGNALGGNVGHTALAGDVLANVDHVGNIAGDSYNAFANTVTTTGSLTQATGAATSGAVSATLGAAAFATQTANPSVDQDQTVTTDQSQYGPSVEQITKAKVDNPQIQKQLTLGAALSGAKACAGCGDDE